MNGTTVLQIPMTKSLRDGAGRAAKEMGFSSLQESIRVFLRQLAEKIITVSFEPKAIRLSPKAIKRYNRMIDEVESGKVKTVSFANVDKMMEYLHSSK